MSNRQISMQTDKQTGYPSIDKPWLKNYGYKIVHSKLVEGSVYDYLVESNQENLNNIALNYYGNKITYAKLFKKIEIISRAFTDLGIKKGEIVPIAMVNTPEMVISFYALNRIGAVSNWVDLRTLKESIKDAINLGARNLIILKDCLEQIKDLKTINNLQHIITISPTDNDDISDISLREDMLQKKS